MSVLNWGILVLSGGLIGWVTNKVAIYLLFRPYKSSYFFGLKIQGLIPRRKNDLAKSIGMQVEKELLSIKDLTEAFDNKQEREELKQFMGKCITQAIVQKLSFTVSLFVEQPVSTAIKILLDRESDGMLNQVMTYLSNESGLNTKISKIVEQKIIDFPMEKIEEMTLAVASKELKHIERVGGVLGMSIGFFQGFLIQII